MGPKSNFNQQKMVKEKSRKIPPGCSLPNNPFASGELKPQNYFFACFCLCLLLFLPSTKMWDIDVRQNK